MEKLTDISGMAGSRSSRDINRLYHAQICLCCLFKRVTKMALAAPGCLTLKHPRRPGEFCIASVKAWGRVLPDLAWITLHYSLWPELFVALMVQNWVT